MMAVNRSGGFKNSAAFSTDQLDLLVSLGAGNVLTRFTVKGISNSPGQSVTLSTTGFLINPITGGLQYGPAGYGGHHLTTGDTSGATWVSFGDLIQPFPEVLTAAGLPPQNISLTNSLPLNFDWRGLFLCTAATDFYLAVGTYPGMTYNMGCEYRWSAEWAS